MSDTTLPATIHYPRAAIEAMLRQIGIKGGIAQVPTLVAMRLGANALPPELARLAFVLKNPDITCRISFVAENEKGEAVERFDVVIA